MTTEPRSAADFATTQWSLVLRAARPDDATARAALETLCRQYWWPLYAFARRRGAAVPEAQDLTQEFFVRLLEKNSLAAASPERGRFRSFLLTSLKNFLANEWNRANAQKRGGGWNRLSLDWESGESRLSLEPADTDTPCFFVGRALWRAIAGRVAGPESEQHGDAPAVTPARAGPNAFPARGQQTPPLA
jgi:RNA polymerase sigma-70 factor (ECF subfamily)